MRALDETQTAWLLTLAEGTRLYMPLLLAVATGMRRGEVLGLRWEDVDLLFCTLAVRQAVEQTKAGLRFKEPKNQRARTIAPSSFVVAALKCHKEQQDKLREILGSDYKDLGLVCPMEDGEVWKPNSFTPAVSKFIGRARLKGVRFHDLRHSHATQLLKQGVHPKVVSERLGHSSVQVTLDTYSHVLPGMKEAAASQFDQALRAALQKQREKVV